ncbi:hypothetical protein [Sphingomonas sp. VNH70]|uniref:hypothetical protein n=1 Tax=Sphingomonas silueang TaxID=3156617 RepID=UPI0032B44061
MTNPTVARALLEARLEGKDSVKLTEAQRWLSNARIVCDGREVSRILRSMDFERAGWADTGYDRTPLYRRSA